MMRIDKLLESRNEWKGKAAERATEVRRCNKAVKRHKAQIIQLKRKLEELASDVVSHDI
jgi:chromosome segregation ATPase